MSGADFGTLPSTRAALLSAIDPTNSYQSTRNSHTASVSVSFNYSHDKRERRDNNYVRTALWRLRITPSMDVQT